MNLNSRKSCVRSSTGDSNFLIKSLRLLVFGLFLLATDAHGSQVIESEGQTSEAKSTPVQRSVSGLEKRLATIDQRLSELAQYSLRSGVGAIGYRSKAHRDAKHQEWLEVELDSEQAIDEVILVPNILRDEQGGFSDDAFPKRMRLVLEVESEKARHQVATFEVVDPSKIRVAPLIIKTDGKKATHLRVEVDELPARHYDGRYLFQIAELLVFSKHENVALNCPVKSSSNAPTGSPAWDQSYAVDGFVPYIMNSAKGNGSVAFVSGVGVGDQPTLTVDLKSAEEISQINLHIVDQGDTVPQTFNGDFGLPRVLKVEGASREDFTDAMPLFETIHEDLFDCGPIKIVRFPPKSCRYVRFTATDPYLFVSGSKQGTRIGFAEIEILSGGENKARNKDVAVQLGEDQTKSVASLTDGRNFYGEIIQIREWLEQLAERHDLEAERLLVAFALNERYQRQKRNMNWLIGLACFLAVATLFALVIGWNMRHRAVQRIREQIAADLHDELGANFHAISLLTDLANASADNPERLRPLLGRMRELTERSGKAAGHCANMLEAKGLYDDLVKDMKRMSKRITADLSHQFSITGEEHLNLSHRKRIGLFLFHQECLTNIIRHSRASQIQSKLTITADEILLVVNDNGVGLPNAKAGPVPMALIPSSLKRRARLLGAKVSAHHHTEGGTAIELRLPMKDKWSLSRIWSSNP